ncbi:MAG: amidohydrolase family protein [Rhodospirillaceae bacterium]|jgi:cytosine deaminase|nr:amidohydrolase family protein [Rhodospirillaceae bacterium]MBT4689405.1 amidohydrolase family protein [Rhodospirillaceae bacterium]MBT5081040.1 amidohydrolase family protein [Rhodospirillaceae bacterium]MBT5527509.1 amidohydrolase family protein [Rhodospirillaceae bacterium]MBT5879711.1 amidohydrolase family protein [Rhodospirillaceae bacterium]
MAFDLILRGARIAGTAADTPLMDIAVQGDTIAAIEPNLAADGNEWEMSGRLVSPGLIESHIHLDKSRIMDRCTAAPDRGTDHMHRVSAVKPGFSQEDVYTRAKETVEQCVVNGTTHMRTHVELDPNGGLRGFEALKQLAADYRWAIDIELCVFAQEGLTNVPETDANLVAALKNGATVIGGAPGYDPDHGGQIRRIFELARKFDVDVDIHLDVGPTVDDMDIHLVCELTEQFGWGGRVAVGHGTKYSCLPPDQLRDLGARLANTGVAVTVLPATDLFVMGRHQDHSVMRGVADANALLACGVNCSLSTNNVLNPFTPFGDCSLIRIANLYANVAQRGGEDEMAEIFEMLTNRSARLLRREDYGIEVGKPADLVVWDAHSGAEAVATIARPLHGFKRGRNSFSQILPELHRP